MNHKARKDAAFSISTERLLSVIKAPILTEKSSLVAEKGQHYFKVALDADKREIKKAIEHLFSVSVNSVNTLVVKGKRRVFKGKKGRHNDYKKAVVILSSGHKIDFESSG